MSRYVVRVAAPAREQAAEIARWWRENREAAPDLFEHELVDARARRTTPLPLRTRLSVELAHGTASVAELRTHLRRAAFELGIALYPIEVPDPPSPNPVYAGVCARVRLLEDSGRHVDIRARFEQFDKGH